MHGGEEKLNKWKHIMDTFGDNPDLKNTFEFYDMTTQEMQENLWKRMQVVYKLHKKIFFEETMFKHPYVDGQAYFQSTLPVTLHITMFRLCLENLANDEQKAYWLPKSQNVEILGCYCQTELGHGSNISGLETTATFDREND